MLKTLWDFRLSAILTIAILAVCLIPVPETPLQEVKFMDKYTHFLMFWGYASALWIELGGRLASGRFRQWIRFWGFCFPILFGGAVEVFQATLTTTRSGDVTDFLANSFGVLSALPIGMLVHRFYSRHSSSV